MDLLQLNGQDMENSGPAPSPIKKLSVLMPVYNERWTLETIVERVLNAPVTVEIELIIVDDHSTDGSWDLIQKLAENEPRIRAFRHPQNRGKGSAVRTAIEHITGEVAVVQDADLEYNPAQFPDLLQPIVDGQADAVFGSRFVGYPRRVLFFWHGVANYVLTTLSNMLNDLNLTDMETCYKIVRSDILKQLRLQSRTFTFEPELTCRLAQWGARIYEVPISYHGRTYQEGKKIRAIDGIKALWEMFRCRYLDPQFTDHSGYYILKAVGKADGYSRWILEQVKQYLGQRLFEAGAGIGNLSQELLKRERLVLVDYEEMYVNALQRRYTGRRNVRVDRCDLTDVSTFERWYDERLDTVFCSNVLEHLEPDEQVLKSYHDLLVPGGHCIIVVPARPELYNGIDKALGHCRRYTQQELTEKMQRAGFEVAYTKQFSRLAAIAWNISGKLGRTEISPFQMTTFDRILPIAKAMDYLLPIDGMSLICVGRKPQVGVHAGSDSAKAYGNVPSNVAPVKSA